MYILKYYLLYNMFAALNSHIDEFTLSVEILYKYLTQVDDILSFSHICLY